ncbi:MAG: FtsW cell division protein [Pseudomonadota bacterium]|jgi:cell division protein FtsW
MKLGVTELFQSEASLPETSLGQRSRMMEFDQLLVWVTVLLLLAGVVMVYSASIAMPDSSGGATEVKGHHYLARQAVFVMVGLFAGVMAFRVRIETWQRLAPYMLVAGLVLLVVVLIPGISKEVKGARRWIGLGSLRFQPSELMKLVFVIYAADYTVRKQQYMDKLRKGFLPMASAVAAVGVLLLWEPDLGAFGVIVCIAMGILFLGGFNVIWFGGMMGLLVSIFTLAILFSPWRQERMIAFFNPWTADPLGKGYQLTHSLIAFGRGELFGVGLGASVEKLQYLPEAHTDFLLAVIGEELGLAGVLIVTFLFYWIVRRAFEIGRQAIVLDNTFAGLAAKGIGIWIGAQTFINMGVNLGLLPTKGLTLPLMSYGGSGVLINCIGLAILLRIDFENRSMMRGART